MSIKESQVFSRDRKLGSLQGVPHEWFTNIVAARIKTPITDKAAARSNMSALLREQAQSTNPYDWHEELAHFQGKNPTDRQRWEPHIGTENDNYPIGIAASDVANGGDGHNYVVVHMCDTDASKKLHAFFNNNPEMTIREFVQSPQYRMTERYQSRNARRIAARIAGALEPTRPVSHVIDAEEDKLTAPQMGSNLRNEMMARPTYHVVYNCFDADNLLPVVKQAHLGTGILYRPAEANVHRQSSVIKALDPSSGFLVRKCSPVSAQVEPVYRVTTYDKKEDNAAYMGRKENRQALKQHVQTHYLNRFGETPSSASRPLWQVRHTEELRDGDIKLTPLVLVIHGVRAATA